MRGPGALPRPMSHDGGGIAGPGPRLPGGCPRSSRAVPDTCIKGGTYQALVDSGCNQTSIHQSLIQQRALDTSRKVKVRCVHGDVANYPLVPVAIKFRGKIHRMEVAVNSHLKHPLILGTDWPAFTQLLGIVYADASWPTGRGQEEAAARSGEALAGPAPPASGETRASEGVRTPELDDFPLEQSRDETLKNAYDRVRSIDGQLLRPDAPLSYPYFSLIKESLYRVTQEAQSKEITTQLLVPKSRREMLFQTAHCTPMAGHLGEAKTRKRLMARFFWPGLHENVRRWCAACRECQLYELYELLGIKSIRTSVYHPQTDGLVERFNRTLKNMVRKFVKEDAKNWDKWLEPLLFAVREVPQASTGFSPFELLYGRQPRGVLDVIKESWEEGPSNSRNEIQYVLDLRAKLHTLGWLSMENLLQAQDKQMRLYNRGTRLRQFTPGDKVLVLLPTSSSKLLAKWQGPFVVTRRVGELDYEVKRTDRGDSCQIYHLNLLKRWNEGTSVGLAAVVSNEDDLRPEAALKNHPFALVSGGDHLSPRQLTDLARLQADFADVFSPLPGRTDLVQHHIETLPGEVARSRPYHLPEHKKNVVREELKAMLNLGVIEESHSDWASPIVLVPKTDGSVRFCVDYRKVNAIQCPELTSCLIG